jgi:NADH:ubiquinone oxidoreductase subunit 4 (subunit M)
MVPLVILMLWIGLHPNTFLRKMTPSVEQLLTTVEQGRESGSTMVARGVMTRRGQP